MFLTNLFSMTYKKIEKKSKGNFLPSDNLINQAGQFK
ncbi:hypothetical protein N481_09210 [Pseudoalteromonas luteoviolacea S4047-1]|uniref:Uncharacterized protein n=1 Tax=Pseudoalteromonas luteoviolacea S4054 TaxID=1129367 RepID=A0A0F6A984_9GAMM|nr:hypothetical protein N479_20265 [Pseudoalteromonas luteoviolacea S4054]KZN74148.1 hypothetical protein N481_09210 [Pseudoalteromonas luteoviolacea S4047-1]